MLQYGHGYAFCLPVFVKLFFFQVWRLITNFLYFGPIGFNFFFNLIFAYRYCRMLEEVSFHGRTGDFFFMFLVGGSLMIVSLSTLRVDC